MSVSLDWRPMLLVTCVRFLGFQEFWISLFWDRFMAVEGRELRRIFWGSQVQLLT